MADIDMIPRSYREAQRARRILARYGIALALLLVIGTGVSALLRWRVALETPRLALLRGSSAQADAARSRVAAAQLQKNELDQHVAALAALRGAGTIGALAGALDGALNDAVWFGQLTFSRTQEQLRDPLPAPLPASVLQIHASTVGAAPVTWRLANHVEISGQALDHQALTRFLNATSSSPALGDLRFLKSSVATTDGSQLVAFSIAGPLRPLEGTR